MGTEEEADLEEERAKRGRFRLRFTLVASPRAAASVSLPQGAASRYHESTLQISNELGDSIRSDGQT